MKDYENIHQELQTIFGKQTLMIDKKALSTVIGLSVNTISNYITKGYSLPKYIKIGNGNKNSSVRFYLTDVAQYLYDIGLQKDNR